MDSHVEELVGKLDSPDGGTRLLAMQELVTMQGPDVEAAIRVAAESPDAHVRSMARKALAGQWSKAGLAKRRPPAPPPPSSTSTGPSSNDVGPDGRVLEQGDFGDAEQEASDDTDERLGPQTVELTERSLLGIYWLALRMWLSQFVFTVSLALALLLVATALVHGLGRFVPIGLRQYWYLVVAIIVLGGSDAMAAKAVADSYLARPIGFWRAVVFCLRRGVALVTAIVSVVLGYAAGLSFIALMATIGDAWLVRQVAAFGAVDTIVRHQGYQLLVLLFIGWARVVWCFSLPVAVIEDEAFARGLVRSRMLVRGSFVRVLVFHGLVVLPSWFVMTGVLSVHGTAVVMCLAMPLSSLAVAYLYFDRLVRKENLTVDGLARTQRRLTVSTTALDDAKEPTYFG